MRLSSLFRAVRSAAASFLSASSSFFPLRAAVGRLQVAALLCAVTVLPAAGAQAQTASPAGSEQVLLSGIANIANSPGIGIVSDGAGSLFYLAGDANGDGQGPVYVLNEGASTPTVLISALAR